MKKILCFAIMLVTIFICTRAYSQGVPVYPIPFYNVEVNGYATFREAVESINRVSPAGKMDFNVMITLSQPGHEKVQATVWFYSLDSTETMGPFTVTEGEVLSKEIDFNPWGALVESDCDILVSVWIGSESKSPLTRRKMK